MITTPLPPGTRVRISKTMIGDARYHGCEGVVLELKGTNHYPLCVRLDDDPLPFYEQDYLLVTLDEIEEV